jgi:hypothetical protein
MSDKGQELVPSDQVRNRLRKVGDEQFQAYMAELGKDGIRAYLRKLRSEEREVDQEAYELLTAKQRISMERGRVLYYLREKTGHGGWGDVLDELTTEGLVSSPRNARADIAFFERKDTPEYKARLKLAKDQGFTPTRNFLLGWEPPPIDIDDKGGLLVHKPKPKPKGDKDAKQERDPRPSLLNLAALSDTEKYQKAEVLLGEMSPDTGESFIRNAVVPYVRRRGLSIEPQQQDQQPFDQQPPDQQQAQPADQGEQEEQPEAEKSRRVDRSYLVFDDEAEIEAQDESEREGCFRWFRIAGHRQSLPSQARPGAMRFAFDEPSARQLLMALLGGWDFDWGKLSPDRLESVSYLLSDLSQKVERARNEHG